MGFVKDENSGYTIHWRSSNFSSEQLWATWATDNMIYHAEIACRYRNTMAFSSDSRESVQRSDFRAMCLLFRLKT